MQGIQRLSLPCPVPLLRVDVNNQGNQQNMEDHLPLLLHGLGHDARGRGDGLNGPVNMMKPPESVTAALPEAMRNLELPPLPAPAAENAALLFGDWLTVITPLMGDLSTSSKEFLGLGAT